jgi:hypothetical protein
LIMNSLYQPWNSTLFLLLLFPLTSKSSFEEASDHYKRKRKFF